MYKEAFEAREDLGQYGSNALLLYALELKFDLEDIHTVASDALTDGSDDKKCDLIYVDADDGIAIIAQCFVSADETKREAPANKASDLNTGAGWLLTRELEELPERIRPAAIQLRSALIEGKINTVHFWYVHNLPSSQNVQSELETVKRTAYASLSQLLGQGSTPNVSVLEVGKEQIEQWYQTLTTPILVTDTQEVRVEGGYRIESADWSAYVTAVPARWLHGLFSQYRDNLFSANVRGYLGSRRSDANINSGIKNTASDDPAHFWVYNNGLTIVTHDFTYNEDSRWLQVSGMSIVNGAQTTGAIGSLLSEPNESAMVPARFVKCRNTEVVDKIIQYNNSQNRVEAPDFRSNDEVQTRLRDEFEQLPSVTYLGGRRGGYDDRIRRPPNLLPSDTAGQALAAFHGNPVVAYNEKSRIWVSDTLYSCFFSDRTTAKHIVFAYSLLRAVEEKKRELTAQPEPELTRTQGKALQYFRNRGSTFLLAAAMAASLENLLDRAVPDTFALQFTSSPTPNEAIAHWQPIVNVAVAFVERLTSAVERGLKSTEQVERSIEEFVGFMEATREANGGVYRAFGQLVSTN
ncbi:AIPR family protein [Synechococcus sp. BA-132 BA5]|uniref:AIPR family protein n=1 Tax=Synechococcus sp. BA-132 BA5 TaxID=3110252 RepID=UPI002B211E1F|nr:AIPR family protein [Synechococcus sp. BA-132 BA5]MEA5415998.1 AIPR family protein [Synechococcus sp. BA-132 BA5]